MRFLYASTVTSRQLDREIADELSLAYLQLALEPLLSQLVSPLPENGDPGRLTFVTFHGVDAEPLYCGETYCQLWLSDEGELTLTTWPSAHQWGAIEEPVRSQVIASGVSDLAFRFYLPQLPADLEQYESLGKQSRITGRASGWFSTWNYDGLPAMIEVSLQMGEEPRRFFFSPIYANEPIVYYMGES